MASFLFRLIRVIIVLGIAVGLAIWLYASRQRPEKQQVVHAPPGVRVVKAVAGTHAMTVDAFGTVVPRKKVNLAAEIGGRIAYLNPYFREGAAIKTSDLLIRMDQRSLILDRDAAKAQVRQVKADIDRLAREIENYKADVELARQNVELTETEWERVKQLGKNQFASKTSVDKAEQQYLAARIQLQSSENRLALTPSMMAQYKAALALAENKLDQTRLVLEKSEIRSGFDGYILTKQAEVGEFVAAGQVLGTLYEKGELDVDVRIPMEELAWMKPLFEEGGHPRAEVTIANFQGSSVWRARVARIKASIDEKTRTLPITVEIAAEEDSRPAAGDALLKPGTFVRCRIVGETHNDIFVLPRYLVHQDNHLYLVTDGKLEMRKVEVLRKVEDEVYVSAGLQDGELVVSSPLPGAVEGMPLTVKGEGDAQ